MGRELKRVPLDFDWPLNKIWVGYKNQFYSESHACPSCGGNGLSSQAKHLQDKWYGHIPFLPEDRGSVPFTVETSEVRSLAERNVTRNPDHYGSGEAAIVKEAQRLCGLFNSRWCHHLNDEDVSVLVEDRLRDLTHTWDKEKGWQKKDPPYIPSAREVNRWSLCFLGHDSINCWLVISAECKRLGVPDMCEKCHGDGREWPSPETKRNYETWTKTDPPTGEGFQLWETTSEGSPVSPVFSTLEELCEWAESNATTFADEHTSKEQWMKMLKEDLVCHTSGNMVFI